MKDPVILKSSLFGGFKKAGVLSYIDQLDSESQKLKAELDEKIAQLEQQVASLEKQIPTEAEKQEQQQRLEDSRQKNQVLLSLTQKLEEEIGRQNTLLEQKDEEIRQATERIRKLQFTADSHALKAQKYDDIAMKIGSLIIEAKQQADAIVEKARAEADAITKEKEEKLEKMNGEFIQFKANMDDIRQQLQSTMASLDGRLEDMGTRSAAEAGIGKEQPKEEKRTFAPFHLAQNFR